MNTYIEIGDHPDDGSGRQDVLRFASRAHTTVPAVGSTNAEDQPRCQSTRRSTCACEPVARDDNIKTDGDRLVPGRWTARSIVGPTAPHEEPVGLTFLTDQRAQ